MTKNRQPIMNLQTLRSKVKAGEIDTVIVAFPDVFGRLMGKRFTEKYFVDSVVEHGTHACNYLMTVDLEMEPMTGFKLANWEKGFGDFEMRPDLETLRLLPWQPGTALVICSFHHEDGTIVAESPRAVLQRQMNLVADTLTPTTPPNKGEGAPARKKFVCNMASELEFFLFNTSYHDAFTANYRNLAPSSDYRVDYQIMQPTRDEPLFRSIRNMMEKAGV